ncbi:MAG: type II toxin-antitoxin system PemK/MazF family toxin [Candidatus Schekmanbacteria bacterium]|nr:type II toxin-antitoxin system PemK/MazF family toxin [Candidatus Schekmanbacteria bacterium]
MRRGDLFWADIQPRSGSEQQGTRPVVVLSHDSFNDVSAWRSVIVVPISTSARQAARGPTVVTLPKGTGGLTEESVAIAHQITTLDRSKLNNRIGTLPAQFVTQLERAIRNALDLTESAD